MSEDIKIIKEAAKTAKKKKEKPLDPNEEARKRNGLPKHHTVGHTVHAGLAVKGGAGYRGKVVRVDDKHTYIDIGHKRIVKAPHRLVTAHEETVHEETKEENKDRLKREAEIAARSFSKYKKQENEKEAHDERRKHHHEHERKMHREEVEPMKENNSVTEANTPSQAKAKLDKHASDLENRLSSGDKSNKTNRVAQAVKAAYKIAMKDPSRKQTGSIVNPSKETIEKSKKNLSDFSKKTAADAYLKGDADKAKKFIKNSKHYSTEETAWDSDAKKEREVEHFHIVSKSTGRVVGKAKTMKSARTARDKHDNNYGSYNHTIKPVWKEETEIDVNAMKAHHRKQQIQRKIIDEDKTMKIFGLSENLVKTVKAVMEKKMSKDELAALGGDKEKVDAEDFEALGRGEHKKKHKKHKKHHVKEEAEVAEGSTYGVDSPKKKKGQYASDDGRHVAKVHKKDNEYVVSIHSDGKHNAKADYFTDDKEDAHGTAKAMLAHAAKHAKTAPKSTSMGNGKSGFSPKNEETSLVSKIINKYINK